MNRLPTVFGLLVILTGNIIFVYFAFIKGNNSICEENYFIENLQAVLVITSCLVFLAYLVHMDKPYSFILWSLSLLCFSFLLHELDVEKHDLPSFIVLLGSGTGRNIMLPVLWAFVAVQLLRDFSRLKKVIRDYLWSYSGIMLIICGGLLIAGSLFDHKIIVIDVFFRRCYEELFELNGYFMLFGAALTSRSSLRKISNPSPLSHP
jgi:hypothetical protein